MRKNATTIICIYIQYVSIETDSLFGLPCCFKNISDVEKAIEDHTLATNSSFSVCKTEHGFNAKGVYDLFHLPATYFAQSVFFFRYEP